MGAGLILYANAFGHRRIHRFFSFKTFTVMSSSALMVYALSKGYSFFMGANHLESGIPLGRPGNIFSAGLILPLDICVRRGGMTILLLFPVPGRGGVIMQALVTNYYETAAMILFSIGFTMLLLQKNLIKKAIGLNIMDMSVYLFLAAKGYIAGGRAPIADGRTSVEGFINPLPSGLVLTGIVVFPAAISSH